MLFFQSLILAFAIRGPISGLQNTYGSMDVVLAHKHPVSMIDSVDFFFILSTETALITVYDFLHGLERSYMKRLMHSTSVVIRSGQMRHPEDSDIFRYQLCFRFSFTPLSNNDPGISRHHEALCIWKGVSHGTLGQAGLATMFTAVAYGMDSFLFFFAFG